MKNRNGIIAILLAGSILIGGCTTSKGTGALIGAGGGAAAGAGIGALIGGGKGAGIGAAIGAVVGTATGAIIGDKMDKQKAELAKIPGATVEDIKDANDLPGLLVTFDSGILFATGKANLNSASQHSLSELASSLINNPDTDVAIYGHTDNTGSLSVNEKLSLERANAVLTYLNGKGIARIRMQVQGKADSMPVATNNTVEGRAMNRRVEVYLTANQHMIDMARSGK